MATTKIWPIKDTIKRVLDYAGNPEKTEWNDLAQTLHYAEDGQKTEWFQDEKVHLVSSINCVGDPYEAMMRVREHFGDRGSVLAFHAYQSFMPGEVTPDECHRIGVELAQRLWGDRYQVVVASHLNKSHLHNHLVLNPISFIDGKKIDSGYANYYRLRDTSDEICREHGLSVIQNPKGKTPRNLYFAERAGDPTRYNLMKRPSTRRGRFRRPGKISFFIFVTEATNLTETRAGNIPRSSRSSPKSGRGSSTWERIIPCPPSTRPLRKTTGRGL